MTITAVIAEYNPFHNGHAYQLAKARELTGADYLVVIMSGDFVQRGAPAILDQHDRAELALLGGADLVLQLPCHFALGSAQHFARGAVSLLLRLAVSIFSALAVNMETRRRFWNSLMFCSTSRRNTVSCSPVCFGTDFPSRRRAHRHFPLIFLTALPSLRFQKKNLIPF